MKRPTWTPQEIPAGAILDAVENTKAEGRWLEIRPTQAWTDPDTYLAWAADALTRDDTFGWDAAVVYAKRAVCRQIDAFMVAQHMGGLLQAKNYPAKVKVLNELGIDIPDVVHDLIIDPRNNIEHAYEPATKTQARHAVQLCKLFLTSASVIEESQYGTIVSLGMTLNTSFRGSGIRGKERQEYDFEIPDHHLEQSVLVDYFLAESRIFVLRPRQWELLHCPMAKLNAREVQSLAASLRRERKQNHQSRNQVMEQVFPVLREDLGLDKINF
ncbi:MAG: hypothetical protein JNK76_23320 [Planctomycetales bacterium]|nr:hypothetical protein [Planctomycetales bacterium]